MMQKAWKTGDIETLRSLKAQTLKVYGKESFFSTEGEHLGCRHKYISSLVEVDINGTRLIKSKSEEDLVGVGLRQGSRTLRLPPHQRQLSVSQEVKAEATDERSQLSGIIQRSGSQTEDRGEESLRYQRSGASQAFETPKGQSTGKKHNRISMANVDTNIKYQMSYWSGYWHQE